MRLNRPLSAAGFGLALSLCMAPASSAIAPNDEVTYQGKLHLSGSPVNDTCDFRFRLYDASSNGNTVGSQLTAANVLVVDGIVTVDLDFGPGIFTGQSRWLEIDVRCPAGAGAYTTLSPRQPITAAPYALKSLGNTMAWVDGAGDVHTLSRVGIGTNNANQELHISGDNNDAPVIALANESAPTNQRVVGFQMNSNGSLSIGRMDNAANNLTRTDVTLGSNGELKVNTANSGRVAIEEIGSNQGQRPALNVVHTDSFHGQTVAGRFETTSGNGTAVSGFATATTGPNRAISGTTLSPTGYAGWFNGNTHFENGFVSINRTTTISGAEVFGIRSPFTGTSYGGMYIDTASDEGRPFYGFASGGTGRAWIYYNGANDQVRFYAGGDRVTIDRPTGNVGIGTTAPAERLHIVGGTDTELASGGFIVTGPTTGTNISMDNNEIQARVNGSQGILYLNHSGGSVHVGQNSGGTSRLVTPVLQITGGSDFSEMFDVGGEIEVEPGMVVVIDPDNPGRLIPSTAAYDCKVAGVVSGAGGVATGMTMGQSGTIADGEHPVALTGRVYCFVDASDAPVRPGDMLTTSDRPGHAMKVTDRARANGAVIGKAMTSLGQGEVGLVLVLVNLQ